VIADIDTHIYVTEGFKVNLLGLQDLWQLDAQETPEAVKKKSPHSVLKRLWNLSFFKGFINASCLPPPHSISND